MASDNKGIPEGNDRIYFKESNIYFAVPERNIFGKKCQIKKHERIFNNNHVACTAKIFCKPALQMEKQHCDESDVVRVMNLKPGKSDTPNEYKRKSNERIEPLNSLRNKGKHECQVLESQEGDSMLLRRPQGGAIFFNHWTLLRMGGRFTQTRQL